MAKKPRAKKSVLNSFLVNKNMLVISLSSLSNGATSCNTTKRMRAGWTVLVVQRMLVGWAGQIGLLFFEAPPLRERDWAYLYAIVMHQGDCGKSEKQREGGGGITQESGDPASQTRDGCYDLSWHWSQRKVCSTLHQV